MTAKFFLNNTIDKLNLKNKRVFLRVDLNVPIKNNKIMCDYKYTSVLPTIKLLLSKGAKIIIATHIGRPEEKKISANVLLPLFAKYKTIFQPDLDLAIERSKKDDYDVLLIENLRFFKGEQTESKAFAKKLAQLGDYFVNDAFGVLHRKDTSVTILPKIFGKEKCFLGLLIEHELKRLNKLIKQPKRPYTFIIGGKKLHSKLPLIEKMIDKVDTILLCPAMSFTFAKQLGKQVGRSLVDDTLLSLIPTMLKKAKKRKVTIMLPMDYQVAKERFEGPVSYIKTDDIPDNYVGVSIGNKTEKLFFEKIRQSKTVFFNGAFGNFDNPETLRGIQTIFKAMSSTLLFSVIAGGDSVAYAYTLGIAKKIDHLSTGGGASLTYVSGEELPGLNVFKTFDHP